MKQQLKQTISLLLVGFFLLLAGKADAHHPDQSYLYLRIYKNAIGGRFEMTAKDMNKAMGLNMPDRLTMEIVQPHLETIYTYLKSRSDFKSDTGEQYTVRFVEPTVLNLKEMEDFVRFHFEMDGVKEVPDNLEIFYDVLFDKDPLHRGMLIIEYNWKLGIVDNEAMFSNVYSPGNTQQTLSLADASIWKGFVALVKLGIWHIWIGLDHILFIVALILPAVVRRKKEDVPLSLSTAQDGWQPVERFKPAFFYILKIITFFTIAHSITLALAALDIINLPSWLVESIIAFSIALAALHNIKPLIKGKEWLIAFGFGLFHGFGFASVLGEKGLSGDYLVPSLLGFNLGVEIGQVLIICMIFPVLFLIRRLKIYPAIIKYGSMALILIALYWFVERAFGIELAWGAYLGL